MSKQPIRAVLKLAAMSPAQKITKGQFILQQWALYGNQFPKTAPNTDAEMQQAVDTLEQTHATAEGGGRLAHQQEIAAELAFDTVFKAYRDWANDPTVAFGDAVKIEQLGLDLNRQPQPAQKLGPPANLRLSGEDEGELSAACDAPEGTYTTIWFAAVTTDADTVPTDADYRYLTASTRARVTLPFKSGVIAWVRVLVVGTEGPSPLSAAVKRRVL